MRKDAMLKDKRLSIKAQMNVAYLPTSNKPSLFVISFIVFKRCAAAFKGFFKKATLFGPLLKLFDNIF